MPIFLELPGELRALDWRPLGPQDAGQVRRLENAVYEPGDFVPEPLEDIRLELEDPANDPGGRSLGAFDRAGELLAYGWVLAPWRGVGEKRYDLWWQVAPGLPVEPLGRSMLMWLEQRARRSHEGDPDPGWLSSWRYARQTDRQALLEGLGYVSRHSEYFMHFDLAGPLPADSLPEGVRLIAWAPEQDELMRQASNAGFIDRWPAGYPGISPEDWQRHYTGIEGFYPPLSLIAAAGDEPAGMMITRVNPAPYLEGEINQISVPPRFRRQGIAMAMLRQALEGFQAMGLRVASLNVDVTNERAVRLYQKAGFKVVNQYISYRKDLTPASSEQAGG